METRTHCRSYLGLFPINLMDYASFADLSYPQWPVLLRHQGPYDSHRGVQLVLTALLGQCYAMMSEVCSQISMCNTALY